MDLMYAINEIAAAIDRAEHAIKQAAKEGGDPGNLISGGLPGSQPRPVRRKCGAAASAGKSKKPAEKD